MALGARIKGIMDKKNIKVSTLAQETNISPQTLYAIIRRDNDAIKPESLQKICKALDVSSAYLMGFDDIESKYSDFDSTMSEDDKRLCLYLRTMGIQISAVNNKELYSLDIPDYPTISFYLNQKDFERLKVLIQDFVKYSIDKFIRANYTDLKVLNKAPNMPTKQEND